LAYGYPKKLKINCTPDNGNKCAMCVVGVNGGERTVTFKDDDRSITTVDRLYRRTAGNSG